ncbi:MAG: hypothetical protein FWG03_04745 [Clostridiales bacterium]|nr:hypothetical protein [Clostridiales bacterium]
MKIIAKRVLVMLLALVFVLAFAACGGKDADAGDDPNLGLWVAKDAMMWGEKISVDDFFGNGFTIELKDKGKCTVNFDGTKANGSWALEDGSFTAKAGGVNVEGTLEGGELVLTDVMGMGLDLFFYKDGEEPSGGGSASGDAGDTAGGDGSGLNKVLSWWNGDFYGYWETTDGWFTDRQEGRWDCYAVIDMGEDGSGTVYFWDDKYELGTVEIQVEESGGVAYMGSATSEGGILFDEPVAHADWVMMPTYEGFEDYYGNTYHDDYMEIEAYIWPDGKDSMNYKIVLRPWGVLWEDLDEDQWPPFYEMWYKNAGYYEYATMLEALEVTNSVTDGTPSYIHSALPGGGTGAAAGGSADMGADEPADSGEGGSGAPSGGGGAGGAVVLDLTNSELEAIWNQFQAEVFEAESTWSKITYEQVVKLLGTEGELTRDEDTFYEYRWYASDDGSLSVRWDRASGDWINSAMNQHGRP